jgi:anti-sigma factor RsiW
MKDKPKLVNAVRESLPEYQAPASLERWAREQMKTLDGEPAPVSSLGRRATPVRRIYEWRIAAGLVIAAAAGWGGASALHQDTGSTSSRAESEIVDAHVRSLLPGHLFDIASSDRHTVKPWFTGKTDIAPPVTDLAAEGFPLVGGRLDYVDGHSAAALAYRRDLHTINLFIWRSGENEEGARSSVRKGYSLVHWIAGGLSYWAVSDAAPSELAAFRDNYVRATGIR